MTNPAGETVQYDWCACGSPSRIVDAKGRITAYTMDMAGRLVKEELPDLSTTTYTYEPKSGRLATKTDAKGQVTHYAYAQDNSIWKTWVTNVASGTASVPEVEYAWDRDFKRLAEWHDNLGTTTLAYVPYNPGDSVYGDGKLYSTDGPWSNDTMTRVYDKLGRTLGKSMDGDKYYRLVQYDSYGRVTSTTNNLGTFGFDYAPHTKRLVSASRPTWTDYYTYESGLKDFALSWVDSFTPMAEGRLLGYNYDVLGRLTGSFEGKFETMGYKDYATSYDAADRLTGWNEIDPGEDYGYDQTAYSNWRYDAAGNRLNYQRTHSEDNFFPFRNEYTVNDADQLVRVRPFGAMHVSGSVNEQAKIITGLSSSPVLTQPDGSFSTWIDTNNPGSASFAVKDFKGNTTNKTADFELDGSLGLGYDFEYDANGNRTRMVTTEYDGDTTSGITYEWDAKNQLVAINMGSHRSEFTYDGMGRRVRIKEIENSVTRRDRFFLWDGLTIIASGVWSSAGINGADVRYFNQGYYSNQATFNGPHYYIKDRLGSVRAVVFDDTVLGSFDYDAYGTPRIEGVNTEEVDFLYTGHFYHRPSGLYLAPYRAYDPQFGRWLSREPLGLDGPNMYHYVFNNPLNSYDLFGLKKRKVILFDPAKDGTAVDVIGSGGVYINNIDDFIWYFNNVVQDGDDVTIYSHGSNGVFDIGNNTYSPYDTKLAELNMNTPTSTYTFMACNFADNGFITENKWKELLGNGEVRGYKGTIMYHDGIFQDSIYEEWHWFSPIYRDWLW